METNPAQQSNLITQAGVSPKPTPGYTTTEFWLLGGLVIVLISSALLGKIPPEFAGVISMFVSLGYAFIRAGVKADHNSSFVDLVNTILTAGQSVTPALTATLSTTTRTIGAEGAHDVTAAGAEDQGASSSPAIIRNSMAAIVPQAPPESAPGAAAGAAPGSQAGSADPRLVWALLAFSILGIGALTVLLSGCATVQADARKVSTYVASPTTQAALGAVFSTAIDVGSGQDFNAVVNGIDAASLIVRSLQSTPNAAAPKAVSSAVTTGGASQALASKVSTAVTTLVKAGQSADAANEAVAAQLDAAAAQLTSGGAAK